MAIASPDDLSGYRRSGGWLGARLRYLARTTSTNDVLRAMAEEGAEEGWVLVADLQEAGRGRLGRRWSAPAGTCLLASLLFRPPQPFPRFASRVTMLCGLALVDAARGVSGVPVVLKWPNDLIVEGDERRWRKAAGLLSEVGGAPDFLVVGVGLNVNVPRAQLPHLAPNATSLMAETGRQVSRVALLDAFLRGVEEGYERLRAGWDPLAEWEGALAWLGREVEVHTPTGSRRGIALGVDDGGALVLRLAEGQARSFPAGDVSLRTAQRVGVGS